VHCGSDIFGDTAAADDHRRAFQKKCLPFLKGMNVDFGEIFIFNRAGLGTCCGCGYGCDHWYFDKRALSKFFLKQFGCGRFGQPYSSGIKPVLLFTMALSESYTLKTIRA
jgi:hypothetical protein